MAARGMIAVFTVVLTSLAVSVPAAADEIVALVNDEVVSSRDIDNRVALFLVTGNLKDRQEIRERLKPVVLSMLIDDKLKRQEARRLNIVVPGEEIDRVLSQISSQVSVSPANLAAFLAGRGASLAALRDQVETEIAWVKAVNRLGGDSAQVSTEEVEEELQRRRLAAGKPEYRVGEIFLAVDQPSEEQSVRELAGRLIEEVRGGASFGGLARIFSSGPATESGGDLGWVGPGQLDPELDRVLAGMEPGQLAGPIRSASGYHLLALFGRRIATAAGGGGVVMTLHQVFAPLPASAPPAEVALRIASVKGLIESAANCSDLEARGRNQKALLSAGLGRMELRRLPAELQQILLPLKPGQSTPPMRSADGVAALMVCDREEAGGDEESRNATRRFLREERLAATSRRLLRDLRRKATVDVRS